MTQISFSNECDILNSLFYIKDFEPVNVYFSIIHPTTETGKIKRILIVTYIKIDSLKGVRIIPDIKNLKDIKKIPYEGVLSIRHKTRLIPEIKLTIVSPEENFSKDASKEGIKKILVRGRNFYIGYKPKLKFFNLQQKEFLYTTIYKGKMITTFTTDKKTLRNICFNKKVKFDSRLVKYAKDIPDRILGYEKCILKASLEYFRDYVNVTFINPSDNCLIRMELYKDSEEFIKYFFVNISRNKEFFEHYSKDKEWLPIRVDKNLIAIFSSPKEKYNKMIELANFIMKYVKNSVFE